MTGNFRSTLEGQNFVLFAFITDVDQQVTLGTEDSDVREHMYG